MHKQKSYNSKMRYGKNWLTKSTFVVWQGHYVLATGCLEKRFITQILKLFYL